MWERALRTSLLLCALSGTASCTALRPAVDPPEPALECAVRLLPARSVHYYGAAGPLMRALHAVPVTLSGRRQARGYVLAVPQPSDLEAALAQLAMHSAWNPRAPFLVLVESLHETDLQLAFEAFRRARAAVVLLVANSHVYTYSWRACGLEFTVRDLGACEDVRGDVYPPLPRSLRGCFFNVSVPHWPPFAMNPACVGDSDLPGPGLEQYLFTVMSEVEGFRYRFRYDSDAEAFSTVSLEHVVEGPLASLLTGADDAMLGGMLLLPTRALTFDYMHGHLDMHDEIRILMRCAGNEPAWTDVFICFSAPLWALLALTVAAGAALAALTGRADAGAAGLFVLDSLLGHGARLAGVPGRLLALCSLLGFLISNLYAGSLTSLATRPRLAPQPDPLTLRPCVSKVMGLYLSTEAEDGDPLRYVPVGGAGCARLAESVETVYREPRRFAVVLLSVFSVRRHDWSDRFGRDTLCTWHAPYAKTMYAWYWPRGSPAPPRLRILALRVREAGLVQRQLKQQEFYRRLRRRFQDRGWRARFAVPWRLYAAGLSAAVAALAVEHAARARARAPART